MNPTANWFEFFQLRHAIEDHAGVQRSAFDGGEEFILRRALQVPAKRDAAQVGIHQHSAVAVVPGQTE
jgi:hypothetical protein